MSASRLLFPLDEKQEVHREPAPGREVGAGPGQVGVQLPLVVAGAPGDDVATPHHRLEGVGGPAVGHPRGLDVVVAVDEHGGGAGSAPPLGYHGGVAASLFGGGRKAGGAKPFGQPLGGPADVGGKGRVGANRGDAQEVEELGLGGLLGGGEPGEDVVHGVFLWVRGWAVGGRWAAGAAGGRLGPVQVVGAVRAEEGRGRLPGQSQPAVQEEAPVPVAQARRLGPGVGEGGAAHVARSATRAERAAWSAWGARKTMSPRRPPLTPMRS